MRRETGDETPRRSSFNRHANGVRVEAAFGSRGPLGLRLNEDERKALPPPVFGLQRENRLKHTPVSGVKHVH
jgi:hypothetical protein